MKKNALFMLLLIFFVIPGYADISMSGNDELFSEFNIWYYPKTGVNTGAELFTGITNLLADDTQQEYEITDSSRNADDSETAALYNFAVDNIIVSSDNRIKVEIPQYTLFVNWILKIGTVTIDSNINESIQKLAHDLGYIYTADTIRKFEFYDSNNQRITGQFNKPVKIVYKNVPYYTNKTNIFKYNPDKLLWVKIPTYYDSNTNDIFCYTDRFSIYAVMASNTETGSLNDVYAYPVPWRPNCNDSNKFGNTAGGITFTNLPAAYEIRIYNIAGELLKIINDTMPSYSWDAADDNNIQLRSGAYIYVVKSGSIKKSGKLLIIR